MSYHELSDSGMTAEQRSAERWRIITIMQDNDLIGELTAEHKPFVEKMARGGPVSDKQLFFLRDIKDRYLR